MFPLYDESRLPGKTSWATIFLIIVNVALFLISLTDLEKFIETFGLTPDFLFEGMGFSGLLTSMFFHGGFSHLIGNMWFLWVFGDNLERYLGKLKFLAFYILSGTGSALIYCVLAPDKSVPVIGASGAISGILGGYLLLFPRHKIKALLPVFFFIYIVSIPALIYVGIWFLYQFIYMGSDPFVAYWGHIGGFLTGLILISFIRFFKK